MCDRSGGADMYCGKCGAELPGKATFCPGCGEKVVPETVNGIKSDILTEKAWYRKGKTVLAWCRRIKIFLYIVAGLLLVVFLVWAFQRHPALDIQDVVFDNYGTSSLGDAVDSTVRNQKWSSEKLDDNHYQVTLSGFNTEAYGNFELTFDVNYVDDYVYANASALRYGGETYTDLISLSIAMAVIYGE